MERRRVFGKAVTDHFCCGWALNTPAKLASVRSVLGTDQRVQQWKCSLQGYYSGVWLSWSSLLQSFGQKQVILFVSWFWGLYILCYIVILCGIALCFLTLWWSPRHRLMFKFHHVPQMLKSSPPAAQLCPMKRWRAQSRPSEYRDRTVTVSSQLCKKTSPITSAIKLLH